jgi:hypothetical protein
LIGRYIVGESVGEAHVNCISMRQLRLSYCHWNAIIGEDMPWRWKSYRRSLETTTRSKINLEGSNITSVMGIWHFTSMLGFLQTKTFRQFAYGNRDFDRTVDIM